MELNIGSVAEYASAIKKMFPKGDYWELQISDAENDINKLILSKAELVLNIRKRMAQLLHEAYPATADETIENWERVYLGAENPNMTLENRRALIMGKEGVNSIHKIAEAYGVNLEVIFPFRVGCFGHNFFGQTRLGSQATLSVVFVYVFDAEKISNTETFEKAVSDILLANHIIYFIYTFSDDKVFDSIEALSDAAKLDLRPEYYLPAKFGISRFGSDRIAAPFMADVAFIRIQSYSGNFRRKDIEKVVKETVSPFSKIIFQYADTKVYTGFSSCADGKNFNSLDDIRRTTGIDITVCMPFKPAKFGKSCFGKDRIASPFGLKTVIGKVSGYSIKFRRYDIENAIKKLYSDSIIYFAYGQEVIYGRDVS